MTINADQPTQTHQWILRHSDIDEKLALEHVVDGVASTVREVALHHPTFGDDPLGEAACILLDEANVRAGFELTWDLGVSPTVVAVSEEVER